MKIALLDVETSGLDASVHEILEIAVVVFDDETLEILDTYETKVHPEHIETAHPRALEVNGYTPEEWKKSKAVSLDTMMRTLSAGTQDCIVMAFNIHFDLSYLDEATRKTGIILNFKRYPICLRAIAWHQLDHRNPFDGWSMKSVCERLGVPPEPATHRALNGVMAEFGIYKALKQQYVQNFRQNNCIPSARANRGWSNATD